jgi:signal transduction histidine kinase
MKFFSNQCIRHKLKMIAMASASAALLLACAAFVVNDILSYREVMMKDLITRAKIIGNNSTAALSFGDPTPVEEILSALSADPHLVAACVFGPENQIVVEYRRPGFAGPFPNRPPVEGSRFTSDSLQVYGDIVLNKRRIGTVFLQSDLRALRHRILANGGITALVMLAAMGVALLLADRLQRFISVPLMELSGIAGRVAREQDYSPRARKMSDDEIGNLVEGFNEMLAQIQGRDLALRKSQDELEQRVSARTHELSEANKTLSEEIEHRKRSQQELESTQQKLMEASRQAGMAEVATGVLHNVGNVLNSVNVSATVLQDRLQKSKLSSLVKTAELLRQHPDDLAAFLTDDPKGKLVPGFLLKLADYLSSEQQDTLKELALLVKNIEHIKEVVAMQQAYARISGVTEFISPVEMMEDVLRMNEGSLARSNIVVVRDYAEVPEVAIDKHKVLQILVNLVRNAKQALNESKADQKRLTVRIGLAAPDRVSIAIKDNGVGIPPENLKRIFGHGFTTKKDGHGFGLHSGALAVKEMGGSISVHSEGLGHGAEFALELPARQKARAAA